MKLEQEISQHSFKNDRFRAAINIIYTGNYLSALHSKRLKKEGMTLQQFNILRILRGQHPKPASVKTIRERMLDRMSDASRIVEKLRQKGLITREVSKTDRRNVDVKITAKGLEVLSRIDATDDLMAADIQHLTDAEVSQLNDFLDRLRG